MAKLDKEMFDKLQYQPGIAEHVPIPSKVAAILKRKFRDEVLVCYKLKKGSFTDIKKETMLMVYFEDKYGDIHKTHGYSTDSIDWESLAQEVADSWPQYKVKHRKQQ